MTRINLLKQPGPPTPENAWLTWSVLLTCTFLAGLLLRWYLTGDVCG